MAVRNNEEGNVLYDVSLKELNTTWHCHGISCKLEGNGHQKQILIHLLLLIYHQECSQGYTKEGSKFSRSLIVQHRHKFITWENIWPPKITCTIQYMIIHIIL